MAINLQVGLVSLDRALEKYGIEEDPKVLSTTVNRGTCSFAFFLQCMRALDIETLRIKDD